MKCTYCGNEIPDKSSFCEYCDTSVENVAEQNNVVETDNLSSETVYVQRKTSKSKIAAILIAVVSALMLGIAGVVALVFFCLSSVNPAVIVDDSNAIVENDPAGIRNNEHQDADDIAEEIPEDISEANISFITSNVVSYPEISLYFRVVDDNGNPIDNLDEKSFAVKEYLNVNDYLERDVIYASKLGGNDALNVSVAIDRSSSITNDDMDKIKNATNAFLSDLKLGSGDKAEIVSFDTNVMQMCLFTDNKDNLANGVNSMFPYGMTACYDAIATSVQNASIQSGARCVIVFTDGDDNESNHDADSVIRLAREKSVPVYTIGVGKDVRESDLRKIADSTGGTYHHIDDVSAMSRIYDEIYNEQKNLYHVKYVSDTALAEDAERRIVVNTMGGGCAGECDTTYTPVIPVKTTAHNSRYEVIKADVTWEEANRACISKGGHLATITSPEEEAEIIAVAESSLIERLWMGGYTTNDINGNAVGHWVTGEQFGYQNWYSDSEPSRFDSDNAAEFYLMFWKIGDVWSWNDQRNDLVNSKYSKTYKGKMGYIIEYEN